MKTSANVLVILVLGVGLGFVARAMRASPSIATNLPRPDEVVYTNSHPLPQDSSEVENVEPSSPPQEEEWLSRFELTERSGKMLRSEDLLGAPYVINFFFSTCPASCVQANQKLRELQDEFKGENVRFVGISVDPETDTPEVLREYAARFGADKQQWLFTTGDLTYIRRIGGEIFRLPVDKKFHTDRFALVDAEGKVDGFYNWPEKRQMKKLKDRIRELLETGGAS